MCLYVCIYAYVCAVGVCCVYMLGCGSVGAVLSFLLAGLGTELRLSDIIGGAFPGQAISAIFSADLWCVSWSLHSSQSAALWFYLSLMRQLLCHTLTVHVFVHSADFPCAHPCFHIGNYFITFVSPHLKSHIMAVQWPHPGATAMWILNNLPRDI